MGGFHSFLEAVTEGTQAYVLSFELQSDMNGITDAASVHAVQGNPSEDHCR